MKTFRNILIILLVGVLLAVGIIFLEKKVKKPESFTAVDFVENGYEDRTEEDVESEKAYADLMKEVFKNSEEGAKDDSHVGKKPLLQFVTHKDGEGIKTYRLYLVSLKEKDFRIVSVDDNKVYTVKEEGLKPLFQIETVNKAVFQKEPPKTILMTTVTSGPRLLGTVTDGEWNYIDETGAFVKANLELKQAEQSEEELDLGLYNFKLIFTETPDRTDIILHNTETKEEVLIADYQPGEVIKNIVSGKHYIIRVNAEWEKAVQENFFGHIVYEFDVKTK